MTRMVTLSRNFLVLFLVLLQLFAPLVHAHVDEHYTNVGIHLPGLESHDPKFNSPALQAIHYTFSSNNLVVSINTGIKAKHDKNLPVSGDDDYIHQPFFVFNAATAATDINFSPQSSTIVLPHTTSPYAPRAPPVL